MYNRTNWVNKFDRNANKQIFIHSYSNSGFIYSYHSGIEQGHGRISSHNSSHSIRYFCQTSIRRPIDKQTLIEKSCNSKYLCEFHQNILFCLWFYCFSVCVHSSICKFTLRLKNRSYFFPLTV